MHSTITIWSTDSQTTENCANVKTQTQYSSAQLNTNTPHNTTTLTDTTQTQTQHKLHSTTQNNTKQHSKITHLGAHRNEAHVPRAPATLAHILARAVRNGGEGGLKQRVHEPDMVAKVVEFLPEYAERGG